jgi:acyl-CoA reductase-like NAD-dependent aldehyde dehydrogenase
MSISVAHHELVLAGRPAPGGGDPIEVRFPFTGEVVASVSSAIAADAGHALSAAQDAFAEYRQWPPTIAAAAACGCTADRGAPGGAARDITLETGKAVWESRLEVDRATTTFRLAGEEATRIDGEVVPLDGVAAGEGRYGEVCRPIGQPPRSPHLLFNRCDKIWRRSPPGTRSS